MFQITLNNTSGVTVDLKPNGNLEGGTTRYITVEGYPIPLTILDAGDNDHVSESWAIEVFDGQRTYVLGYEGDGNLTITVKKDGVFTASTGFGEVVTGHLVAPAPRLEKVTGLTWSPDNPVEVGTVMTLSWHAVSGATSYDVILMHSSTSESVDKGTQLLDQEVTSNVLQYTLKSTDLYYNLTAIVCAHSDTALPGPQVTSSSYYVGNSRG